jgi:ABC-type transport system substrate-binding protein
MLLMVLTTFAVIPASTVSAAAAAEDDVLYIAMQQDIPDYNNYNLGTNSVWKANVIGFGFESLSATDMDLKSVPLLAESWTFDEDNLVVVITLRQGVLFHDDTPDDLTDNHEMTADDVVFSYLMTREGTTYSSNIINAFDEDLDGTVTADELNTGVEKTGEYEVTMTMAHPFGQFFSSTLAVPIMPMYVWENYLTPDGVVDVTISEEDMTWGTGAFYYADGVLNSYRVMKKFDGYWGKDFLTPAGWPTFPKVVDTLHYKIYGSIDTAILALQGGDVDYIAWAITPGRVPALQSDPNIGLEYMSDSGYFYLAFNMKKEPMNNLTFRQAVSHLIDKDQIVDVYMGGFGQAGSAAVPPYFGEWFNPAVTKYTFDIQAAEDLLDEAGYTDQNDDGWRDMPDGSLMEKITLLTPPADYDPIRIRAGQMLATNMRDVGINIEAKPIDFNTLVAKANTFDYQMLNLGWRFTGYTECVSVLFDIYGPLEGSNTWAFWSETNPNPFYAEVGGVSTLADETTQAYADEFLALETDARASFDTAEQINLVKQGEEIIAKAIPCNVLYYRVNVEAHNKIWTNWTVYSGTLINGYCFCVLDYATAGTSGGGAVTTSLSAGLTMAEKVRCGESVTATVMAIDNLGAPVSGADVEVTVGSEAISASPLTGTTDANGLFEFEVTGEAAGASSVQANVTSGTLSATDSASILVATLGGIAVQVTPEKTFVVPGEDISVDLFVSDVDGAGVEGATVTIDPYLLGFGSITPSTITTDADGMGTMTYTAPAESLLNQHMLVQLAAQVSDPQHTRTNLAVSQIVVYNDAAPDWILTTVDSVTATALTPTDPTTTITVLLTDELGNPIEGETLNVEYSNESRVAADPVILTDATAADGTVSFDVTAADTGVSGGVLVTVGMMTAANSISASVTLTYYDPADEPATPFYGGYMQYDLTKFVEAWGTIHVTAYVFDHEGTPASGVNASIILPAAAAGQMMEYDWDGDWDTYDVEGSALWEWIGATLHTSADGQTLPASGDFSAPVSGVLADYFDYWYGYVPAGVTLTGGVFEMDLYGATVANLDIITDLYLMPASWCNAPFDGAEAIGSRDDGGPWPISFEFWGPSLIASSLGYGRAYDITTVKYAIDTPVLRAEGGVADTTGVTITVYDQDNNPLEGANVQIYQTTTSSGSLQNNDYKVTPCSGRVTTAVPSDVDGLSSFTVTTVAWDPVTASYTGGLTAIVNPDMFIRARMSGYLTVPSQTQLVVEPNRDVVFLVPDPITDVQMIGDMVYITGQVVDSTGAPYADLPVGVAVNIGTAVAPLAATDSEGMATVAIDTSNIADASAAFLAASLYTGGAPEGGTARVMVALVNEAPTIDITGPSADADVVGPNATVTAGIYDANGIAEATLVVDGGTPIDLVATEGSMAIAVSEVLAALADGEHTVTISATDSLGISSEAEVTFNTVPAEETTAGADMLAWGLAAAGWIVAAVVLVFLVLKMRKPKEPAPTPEAEEEKKE